MLVAGKQNVKIQLLADPIGRVFAGFRKHPSAGQIPLKAAVVHTYGQIHPVTQSPQGISGSLHGIRNGNAGQMFRPLPDIHMIRHNAHKAHPQAVFQHLYPGREAAASVLSPDIFANTVSPQGIQIALQIGHAEIEIVVAKGHIVIAAAVHHFRELGGAADGVVTVGPQR